MLSLLGIRQICVIVNKLDLVEYSEEVFDRIRTEMDRFMASLGIRAQACIPLSALLGENVLRVSAHLPWYSGLTLIRALDALACDSQAHSGGGVRFPVQDVYKFDDRRIIAGRLERGNLKEGDAIIIHPGGKRTTIQSFAGWREKDRRRLARTGESIGITVADEFFNQRGEIISLAAEHADQPLTVSSFRASLFWMGKIPLRAGKKYTLKIATQNREAEIREILRVIDASTLDVETDAADEVRLNDVAEVIINTREPVVLDLFSRCRATGRFVLVDGYDVAGGGIVTAADQGVETFYGFIHDGMKAHCELFEEYYYSVEDRTVNKHSGRKTVYTVGDAVPLAGRSFAYPEFFDIAVMRDNLAVKIRGGRVSAVIPLDAYAYEGLPIVNGRGFAFKVRSRAAWAECLTQYRTATDEAAFSSAWLEFTTYRHIPFSSNTWDI
jgi:sulfate adenylyltransferase subunit 1 (EFTu-like GTPase family)